ncbi:Mlp family lipoprotein [Borreliella valaisiana]|uniref:Mlp family lipoprotein n=1 Tax=Borreliella valaisiana TaxID=62088 RepID=UPI003B215F53
MKIINILLCLFSITLNNCKSNNNEIFNKNNKSTGPQQAKSRKQRDLDQKNLQKEEIILSPDEEKKFNSLTTVFKYTIEKLPDQIQGCNNGNKSKCTNFFDWLSKDIQKQKELASAFKKVYDFLAAKAKANNEDFDTYIQGGIDCKVAKGNENCNDNKHGDGTNNLIEQYFRGVAGSIFDNKNINEEIYQCLKNELLNDTTGHYAGLTTNWKNEDDD